MARHDGLPTSPHTAKGLSRKFALYARLARLREIASGAVGLWLAERAFPLALSFEAPRFVLMSSRDSGGGGPYRVEAAHSFA